MILDLSYIDSIDLLKSTGISNVTVNGSEISYSCPSSDHLHGDSRPSARMNVETTAFLCNGCGWRGNAIHFLSKYKSIPETVARRLLEERYGGETLGAPIDDLANEVENIMKNDIKIEENRIAPSESLIDAFEVNWYKPSFEQGTMNDPKEVPEGLYKYLHDRGFMQKSLQKWQIGYDKFSNRITIPIRDDHNNLVGFKGRAWRTDEPIKYLILGDNNLNVRRYGFQTYKKSDFVYGLRNYIEYLDIYNLEEDQQHIILAEGELNVISMDQKGFHNAVSIAGSEFSDIQCELIRTYASSVTIFFDDDNAGRRGTKKVVEKLSPYMPLRVVQNAPGDAAELSKEEIQKLLSRSESALLLEAKGEL
jgi:DNA primase